MLQNDTLKKLMITDSHGQHKDRRNDDRRVTAKASPQKELKSRAVDVEDEEEDIFNRF